MVRRALGFIARTGPATEQDRWEESAGLNPFTLAVSIAALVAGAGLLPPPAGDWALELADFWNSNIERWTLGQRHARSPSGSGSRAITCWSLPGQASAASRHLARRRPDP